MLRALALSTLRIVLLPRETSFLPAIVDRLDEIFPEISIQLRGALLVRIRVLRQVLPVD